MNSTSKIMLVAGEASGDAHGAEVIKAIHQVINNAECFGIGGHDMANSNMEILFDANKIAVMGLWEIITHYREIRSAWKIAKAALVDRRPNLLILIDYPGFNLRLAKVAKSLGIKVLYYISPQVWAWRQNRIYKIKSLVDHMAVILPFEVAYYKKAGVPVSFVGCPIIDEVKSVGGKLKAKQLLGLAKNIPLVGLLPGSRLSELTRLMPTLLAAAKGIHTKHPQVEFVLPIASSLSMDTLLPYLQQLPYKVHLVEGQSHAALEASELLIGSSGTVTLEAAILKTPMIVIASVYLALV